MNFDALHRLTPMQLQSLAASLRDGQLSHALNGRAIDQIAGASAGKVRSLFEKLVNEGFTASQLGRVVEAVHGSRLAIPDPSLVFELVLTGPEVHGVPTQDTAAVLRTLFEQATQEVIVTSYAFAGATSLLQPLHERMRLIPDLRVTIIGNVQQKSSSPDPAGDFATEFFKVHWPWPERPALYYYPASLAPGHFRPSMHAKCVIVDRKTALVTSANITEAASERNIEAGVLTSYAPMVDRLARLFEGLIETEALRLVVT
jgi:phosphatidylserine/phosphatidylglycerophosphate/cardiolipin synthase-like enzyme